MPLVFRTADDSPTGLEIVGVGVLGPRGEGGVPVEQAAAAMNEFWQTDESGAVVRDDAGNPQTLSGQALTTAARKWAEQNGLQVTNVGKEELEKLSPTADEESLAEFSQREYQKIYGWVQEQQTAAGQEQSGEATRNAEATTARTRATESKEEGR
jgi:hypothetical protein